MKKAYITKAEYELGYAKLGIIFAVILIVVKSIIAIVCGYNIIEYVFLSFDTLFFYSQ